MSSQDWFVPLAHGPDTRLFAFPHAGAGCAQLAAFAANLAEHGIAVAGANLPGRQARLAEPVRTEFAPLVSELTEALLAEQGGRDYVLLGYCAGGLLAYGVLRELVDRGAPLPSLLVIISYDAPDIAVRSRRLATAPSAELWSYLLESGTVENGVADDARLRQVAEPAIRADFAVLADYRHRPAPPIPVPIAVYFGESDPDTSRGALLGWRRQTSAGCRVRALAAGKWLIDEVPSELASLVAGQLEVTTG